MKKLSGLLLLSLTLAAQLAFAFEIRYFYIGPYYPSMPTPEEYCPQAWPGSQGFGLRGGGPNGEYYIACKR